MKFTRRTVLKSIAAALMAPTVRLRQEIDREALMRPFCGEDLRYSLSEPFQQGSLTYCSDTRRIIRAELTCPELVGERRLPNAVGLWNEKWRDGQWIEIERPEITDLLPSPLEDLDNVCPLCLGRRISLGAEYPYRHNKEMDERMYRLGYDPDDNTIRDETCPRCQGRDYYGPSEFAINGLRYRWAMLAPIFDLPNVRFLPSEYEELPLLFKADGFEGMTMPLVQV